MTITIYGIKNCDTMKKARAWLAAHDITHDFHDYKANGVSAGHITLWVEEHGWETLLNRAGTTFKVLPDSEKLDLDAKKAIALMLASPSMIKRPVLDMGARRLVGFKPETFGAALLNR